MTEYRFWSGLNTIGGNIVEVRTDKARILCDFGLSVPTGEPTERSDMPQLERMLLNNELPAVPGLYDTTEFTTVELPSYHESDIETALFVSHLHLDHMGGLQYLPEGTTVYMSDFSYRLYRALMGVGEEVKVSADIRPFHYGETVQIGDITVTPKWSDHDAEGSSAFFIQTSDLKLIHSGDLRLTGDHPERVKQWTHEAKEWQPDVLLLEGTSFSFDEEEADSPKEKEPSSESALRAKWQKLLEAEQEQIIFFNPYIRNVERMRYIATIAEQMGRVMVVEPAYASVLYALDSNQKWTILVNEEDTADLPYAKQTVTLQDIQKDPGQYVLQNSYKNREYVQEFTGGLYCHSNGEPLGDYDPRYQELVGLLEENQFQFVQLGTSGHASKDDLIRVAQQIKAKVTVPWHTFRPDVFHEALNASGIPSMLPELDVLYSAKLEEVPTLASSKEG